MILHHFIQRQRIANECARQANLRELKSLEEELRKDALKESPIIRKFDQQIADDISREGAKLIRTLLPDEGTSITEYRYRFTWCDFLTPCKYKNHDVRVGDYDCQQCPHFVDSYIETPIQGSGVLSYAPYFAVGIGVVKCNKK